MDAKLKAQWLDALRSGEYKQGKEMLRTQDNSYCCLGVLCDVVDPDGWDLAWFTYGDHSSEVALPKGLAAELFGSYRPFNDSEREVPNQEGVLPFKGRDGGTLYLSILNDEDGLTFDQIADVIEYAF